MSYFSLQVKGKGALETYEVDVSESDDCLPGARVKRRNSESSVSEWGDISQHIGPESKALLRNARYGAGYSNIHFRECMHE